MVSVDVWRARIGSHHPGVKQSDPMRRIKKRFHQMHSAMLWVIVMHFTISSILLIIGGIELNPGPDSFLCKNCIFKADTIGSHAHHQKIHQHDHNFRFYCGWSSCFQTFFSFKSLNAHISKDHKDIRHHSTQQRSTVVSCSVQDCSVTLSSSAELCLHLKTQHIAKGCVTVTCPLSNCDRVDPFRTVKSFNVYLSQCHKGWKNEDDPSVHRKPMVSVQEVDVDDDVYLSACEVDNMSVDEGNMSVDEDDSEGSSEKVLHDARGRL